MAATFLAKIKSDFPELRFVQGRKFAFRPPRTVVVPCDDPEPLLLLHEVGHAISKHQSFKTEVGRLKMEVEAWEEAKKLCAKYKIAIDEDLIEGELDTYRDWLHQKSRCPLCGLTRFQTPDGAFHCPKCEVV